METLAERESLPWQRNRQNLQAGVRGPKLRSSWQRQRPSTAARMRSSSVRIRRRICSRPASWRTTGSAIRSGCESITGNSIRMNHLRQVPPGIIPSGQTPCPFGVPTHGATCFSVQGNFVLDSDTVQYSKPTHIWDPVLQLEPGNRFGGRA